MITAKEALEKTKAAHMAKIESFILAAIEKGDYKCEILPKEQFISEENKQLLRDNGFKITETVSMLGQEIHINWDK